MLHFGKIAIIGAGNVSYTLCKLLKNKGIGPYCVLAKNPEKAEKVHEDLNVAAVSSYEITKFFRTIKNKINFSLQIEIFAIFLRLHC